MSFTIVISHYNENLDWIQRLPSDNVHLYSKGGIIHKAKYKISYLPNVGRESQTYLHYIIEHYDNLPDIVFFTQGCDDHINSQDIIKCIASLLDPMNININFITTKIEARMINNVYFTEDHRFISWKGESLHPAECNFKEWFKIYIYPSFDYSEPLYISFGACFAVRKEAILSRSKEYYNILIEQLNTHNNTEVGHFFERSWIYIFNSKNTIARVLPSN